MAAHTALRSEWRASLCGSNRMLRNYSRRFDLDTRSLFEQPAHHDNRHGWIVIADDLAVRRSDRSRRREVFIAIQDIPCQPDQVARPGVRSEKQIDDVVQRLPGLACEVIGVERTCSRIPPDLSRKYRVLACRDCAIRIPARPRPSLGLNDVRARRLHFPDRQEL